MKQDRLDAASVAFAAAWFLVAVVLTAPVLLVLFVVTR